MAKPFLFEYLMLLKKCIVLYVCFIIARIIVEYTKGVLIFREDQCKSTEILELLIPEYFWLVCYSQPISKIKDCVKQSQ